MKKILGITLLLFSQFSYAAVVTLFDGEFDDWTTTLDNDTLGNGSYSAGQILTGGNPDRAYWAEHQYFNGSFSLLHLAGSLVYDPSTQGAIGSLSFSYDYAQVAPSSPAPITGGYRYIFILEQGGTLYSSGVSGPIGTSTTWNTFLVQNLFDTNFVSTSGMVDFSSNGAPIRFGMITANTGVSSALHITAGAWDNFQVDIETAVAGIPAPATLALFGLGLAVLGFSKRRKV